MFMWVAVMLLALIAGCLIGFTSLTYLRRTRLAMQETALINRNGRHPNAQLRAVIQLLNIGSPMMVDWYQRENPPTPPIVSESTYTPATELIPGPLILPIPYQRSLLYADDLSRMSDNAEDTTPMPRAS